MVTGGVGVCSLKPPQEKASNFCISTHHFSRRKIRRKTREKGWVILIYPRILFLFRLAQKYETNFIHTHIITMIAIAKPHAIC